MLDLRRSADALVIAAVHAAMTCRVISHVASTTTAIVRAVSCVLPLAALAQLQHDDRDDRGDR